MEIGAGLQISGAPTHQPFNKKNNPLQCFPLRMFPLLNFSRAALFYPLGVTLTFCAAVEVRARCQHHQYLCAILHYHSSTAPSQCNCAPTQFNYTTTVQMCTTSLQLILLPSLAPAPMRTLHFSILPSVQFSCCNACKIAAPDQVHCN